MKVLKGLLIAALTIGFMYVSGCVEGAPKETEPMPVKTDIEEAIKEIEKPELIQEYPRITSNDLEEVSKPTVLDKGQEEEQPEEEIQGEWLAEPSGEEAPIEEPAEVEEDIEEGIQMTDESEADGWIYMGAYQITAYEETGNPCANGNYPTIGYTAACNSLPFGTTVYIEGIGYRTIEDRGADWHSDQWIDVYMGYVWDCNQFGVQYLDVWVVE